MGCGSGLCPRSVPRSGSQGSPGWQRCLSLPGSADGIREGAQGGLGTPAGSMAEAGMQESSQAPGAWKGHFSQLAPAPAGSGVGKQVNIIAAIHLGKRATVTVCTALLGYSNPILLGAAPLGGLPSHVARPGSLSAGWWDSRRSARCGQLPGEPGSPLSAPTFAGPLSTPSPDQGAPGKKWAQCCGTGMAQMGWITPVLGSGVAGWLYLPGSQARDGAHVPDVLVVSQQEVSRAPF